MFHTSTILVSTVSIHPIRRFWGDLYYGTFGVQVGWPADVFLRIWTFRGGLQIASVRLRIFTRSLDINRKISSKIGSTPVRMLEDFRCCDFFHTLYMASSKITFRRLKDALDIPKIFRIPGEKLFGSPNRRPCHGDVWGVQIPPQQVFGCIGMAPCFIPPMAATQGPEWNDRW